MAVPICGPCQKLWREGDEEIAEKFEAERLRLADAQKTPRSQPTIVFGSSRSQNRLMFVDSLVSKYTAVYYMVGDTFCIDIYGS